MKRLLLGLVILAVMASTSYAHGGSYRGPAGEVPPNMRKPEDPPPPNEGGTPTPPPEEVPPGTGTPPAQPGNPARPPDAPPDSGDNGGGNKVEPKAPGGGGAGGGAVTGGPRNKNAGPPPVTFDSWEFWWGYNKDDILNLKARLKSGEGGSETKTGILGVGGQHTRDKTGNIAPTELLIAKDIIPALERCLDDQGLNFDIRAGAVIALGKIGSGNEKLSDQIASRLIDIMNNKDRKEHFSVEESGALALGLLQSKDEAVLNALCDKALDRRGKGNPRTRCFALLALGLLEVNPADTAYDRVVETLRSIVKSQDEVIDDMPVCALTAMGLSGDKTFLDELTTMVKEGRAYKTRKMKDLVRSYAATAMCKIAMVNPTLITKDVVEVLKKSMISSGNHTVRSAVIGFGQLGSVAAVDPKLVTTMVRSLDYVVKKGENQAANFALISLGKIAGATDEDALRSTIYGTLRGQMKKGKATARPFAALALGMMGRSSKVSASKDSISETVRKAFDEFKGDPKNRGGYAIALGMLEDRKSVPSLVKVLEDRGAVKRLRGACAIALGMIRDRGAISAIKTALEEKESRDLRVDTAVAAGLIGDSETIKTLVEILKDQRSSLFVQGSVSLALGKIGDHRAIGPLVTMLEDEGVQDLNRALAAVALGLLGDRNDLPVLSRLARDVNYRAQINAMEEVLSIL